MNRIAPYFQRFGVWAFVSGLVFAFLSYGFRHTPWGIVGFVAALLIAFADPIILILGDRSRIGRTLIIGWAFGLLSLALYLLRTFTDVTPDTLGGEESLAGRVRLLLLVLFMFSFGAAFVLRLAVGMAYGASESLRKTDPGSSRYLQSTALSVIAALPVFVLVNYASAVRNPTLDLSPGYYSFGEASRTIVKSIDRDVQVYAFLPVQQAVRDSGKKNTLPELFRIAEDIRVMLDQLPVMNSRVKVQFQNADLDAEASAEFGTVTNGTIVVRVMKPADAILKDEKPYLERRVYVYNEQDMERLEREAVRALVQVSSPEKNLYFTSSNGERFNFTEKANEPGGIETLKNMLRFYNFQLKALDHNSGWPGKVPDDAAAVVIAGPSTAFGPEARQAILDYLKKNGRVFGAVDPDGNEDLSWILNELPGNQFKFKKAFLSHIPNLPGVVVTDSTVKHRSTENLSIAGRSLLVFPGAGYFDENKSYNADAKKDGILNGLAPTAIVHTPYNTVIDRNRNGKKDDGEESGRYALGITIERPAPNAPEPKPGEKKPDAPKVEDSAKLALYSGVGWLTEQGLRFPVDQRNIILAADTLFWLTESPLAAGLVPEKRETRSIQVTDELKFRNMILGMVIFPLGTAIALAAGIVLYRRRRKFVGVE